MTPPDAQRHSPNLLPIYAEKVTAREFIVKDDATILGKGRYSSFLGKFMFITELSFGDDLPHHEIDTGTGYLRPAMERSIGIAIGVLSAQEFQLRQKTTDGNPDLPDES